MFNLKNKLSLYIVAMSSNFLYFVMSVSLPKLANQIQNVNELT